MNPVDKMKSGELYDPSCAELTDMQAKQTSLINEYNASSPFEPKKREELLKAIFASVGKNAYIEPPLHANWGSNTHIGDGFYANFNLVLVDDADVYIGDDVMIAPNVTIATAGHPIDPPLRRRKLQYNLPVRIGNNVWLGAGVIVLPGVTIGDNSVIGAGSVVTKDIPSGVVAYGNPCRVVREIGEYDREYYRSGMRIPEGLRNEEE